MMQLLAYVTSDQRGLSGGLADLAVITGLALAGVVKLGLRHGWRRVTAPRGWHRA